MPGPHGSVLQGTSGRAHMLDPFKPKFNPKKSPSQTASFSSDMEVPFLSGKQEKQSCSFSFTSKNFLCCSHFSLLSAWYNVLHAEIYKVARIMY